MFGKRRVQEVVTAWPCDIGARGDGETEEGWEVALSLLRLMSSKSSTTPGQWNRSLEEVAWHMYTTVDRDWGGVFVEFTVKTLQAVHICDTKYFTSKNRGIPEY